MRAVGIAVLEQRKPFEDRRGRDAVESRKHSTLTEDNEAAGGASIAVSFPGKETNILGVGSGREPR